ncbi:peroxide stress protein YaaA [Rhodococcus hoagii]|nr:peroxide stress protein YaaA [Prescottella equi]
MFTGVLFDALDHASLSRRRSAAPACPCWSSPRCSAPPRWRTGSPPSRLPVSAKLPGLPGLAAHWRPVLTPALDALAARDGGPVVDCRSGGYAAQWRAPAERTLAVDGVPAARRRADRRLHFAKHTRGLVARALLEAGARETSTLDRVADVVARAGDGPGWESSWPGRPAASPARCG